MTEDRDFKDLVRRRADKTGESYQAARRQLEGRRDVFAARVDAVFRSPDGLAFGCNVEKGSVFRGMRVAVIAEDLTHHATVVSLRRSRWDVESVAAAKGSHPAFGMIVEPPYVGPLPARVVSQK
jgi:translation initiation factor IF-2